MLLPVTALLSGTAVAIGMLVLQHFQAIAYLRRVCDHTWGAPKKVTIGFKVWCSKCGEQEFAHQDGTLCAAPCAHCGRGKRE